MSSRNAYLSADERKVAGQLNVVLKQAIAAARGSGDLRAVEGAAVEALWKAGFSHVDYVAIRDAATLDHITDPGTPCPHPGGGQDRQDPADRQYGFLIDPLRQPERHLRRDKTRG